MRKTGFPAMLQAFFTTRLIQQRRASPHTINAYRNTFRLLLRFACKRFNRAPSSLVLDELDAPFISEFLEHLEIERGNSARSRNARLAAIHAFFRYVALVEPGYALHCQRVLAIPSKRFDRGLVEFLSDEEVAAMLAAPDGATWIGRRDRTILLVAIQTGLRVSELTALCRKDVTFGAGANVRCWGKGRKLRCTPLRRDVAQALEAWLSERPKDSDLPVFPSSRGGRISADALERMVTKHAEVAQRLCRSLAGRRITPHTLRHTAAMQLLQRGVDCSVIALWLGHESIETTQMYLHADLRLKEQALARASTTGIALGRYKPEDPLLAFLEGL
jgi:integrase/recombinase XerD